ncbi:ankyrin repeat and SAM domain-containing protein 3 isoform X3 [Callorhinus ursinus]|uniref:Ankyrin repeat and SAM domain-containing protein 3 isoform X3 n=1 Tax=Callorhinus ursinus TaxID=34884 RepID=A0A3Q7N4B1_CALUR|nr:ankyrin repeat and SAM domain-containing protein 3 isoform X3 [Callorhinus ursinus]
MFLSCPILEFPHLLSCPLLSFPKVSARSGAVLLPHVPCAFLSCFSGAVLSSARTIFLPQDGLFLGTARHFCRLVSLRVWLSSGPARSLRRLGVHEQEVSLREEKWTWLLSIGARNRAVGVLSSHFWGRDKFEDLSSSDESCPVPQRQRPCRKKGLSIHEGPRALARITAIGLGGKMQRPCCEQVPLPGYVTFNSSDENPLEGGGLCYRDVTSPINERDVESSSGSSREEHAFGTNLGVGRCSSSSEGLTRAPGVSSEASLESNEDSDHACKSSVRKQTKSYMKTKNRYSNSESQWPPSTGTSGAASSPGSMPQTERSRHSGPQDLAALLEQIGCLKYLQVFEEQDVDLRIFLTLTESDLKEIGITLFGPKRKMTSAIARWHSSARPPSDALELAYADRLEAEMQELAIQLHKRCEEVEAMRGQVSQEQGLRAVLESCLLEQDGARKDVHAQLQETWALARDAALILDQLRACQAELSARVKQEVSTRGSPLGTALPTADSNGWPASLQALSLPELSGALEDRVQEMGRVLCSVTQSLEKLQVLNGKENWREP